MSHKNSDRRVTATTKLNFLLFATKKNYSKSYKRYDSSVKSEYLEFISESLMKNKQTSEIINDLHERYGSECVTKGTLTNWISRLKCSDRRRVEQYLGIEYIIYWDKMNNATKLNQEESSREDNTNNNYASDDLMREERASLEAITPTASSLGDSSSSAGSVMTTEEVDNDLPEIIEIDSDDEYANVKPPVRGKLIESHKVPESILGKATLNGQTYFMIKWKGPYEDELGLSMF